MVRVTGHQRIRIYLLLKDFWVFHSKLNKQIVVRVALSFFKQWNLEQKPAIFGGQEIYPHLNVSCDLAFLQATLRYPMQGYLKIFYMF